MRDAAMTQSANDNIPAPFLSDEQWRALARALRLSAREAEITRLLMNDESEWTIAAHLSISRHTVHTHIERLYRKLGVTSRSQVIVRVFQTYVELTARNASS
jgi:DNA-binding CsgD family transcriptional regulator